MAVVLRYRKGIGRCAEIVGSRHSQWPRTATRQLFGADFFSLTPISRATALYRTYSQSIPLHEPSRNRRQPFNGTLEEIQNFTSRLEQFIHNRQNSEQNERGLLQEVITLNRAMSKAISGKTSPSAVNTLLTVLDDIRPSQLPAGYDALYHELNRCIASVISEVNTSSVWPDKLRQDKDLTLQVLQGLAKSDVISSSVPATLWDKLLQAVEGHAPSFSWKDITTVLEALTAAHTNGHQLPSCERLIIEQIIPKLEEGLLSVQESVESSQAVRESGQRVVEEQRALTGGISQQYTGKSSRLRNGSTRRQQAGKSSAVHYDIRDAFISLIECRDALLPSDSVGACVDAFIQYNDQGNLEAFTRNHVIRLSRTLGPSFEDSMHPALRHTTHMCVAELSKRREEWLAHELVTLVGLLQSPLRGTIHRYGVNTAKRRKKDRASRHEKIGPYGEYFPDGGGDPVLQYSKISLHTAVKAAQQLMSTCLKNLECMSNEEAVKTNNISIVGMVENVFKDNENLMQVEEDSDTEASLNHEILRVAIGESLFRLLLRYDKSAFAQAYDLLRSNAGSKRSLSKIRSFGYHSEETSENEEETAYTSDEQKAPSMKDYGSDGYSSTESSSDTPLHHYLNEYGFSSESNVVIGGRLFRKETSVSDTFRIHQYRHSALQMRCPRMLYNIDDSRGKSADNAVSHLRRSFDEYCRECREKKRITEWFWHYCRSRNPEKVEWLESGSLKRDYMRMTTLSSDALKDMGVHQLCGLHAVLSVDKLLASIGVYRQLERKIPRRSFVREAQKRGWLRQNMVYVNASFDTVRQNL